MAVSGQTFGFAWNPFTGQSQPHEQLYLPKQPFQLIRGGSNNSDSSQMLCNGLSIHRNALPLEIAASVIDR